MMDKQPVLEEGSQGGSMKGKRILTERQKEAVRKNAAKGRKKLAQMRKAGIPIGKKPKGNGVVHEIPLAMIPAGPPVSMPVAKKRFKQKEAAQERANVDALAQLIVATWQELVKRRGA